jgi:glutamate formiminotransferase/formiminotetrahydrofolate cyclodeaminase
MPAIVECVPNFSEGRRPEIIEQIIGAALTSDGLVLLDHEMDADHNRAVVTFVGEPAAISEGVFRAIARAAELIDMATHTGEHPRMGATDVVPFIPISGISEAECIALAKELGKRVGEELQIPVYLYEAAASRPDRENLADVRRGQYEGLRDEIETNPDRKPDFGPAKMNLKAGATAVGVRFPLVAFNAYLNTPRVSIAKKIAGAIRFGGGGLRYVKAMGFEIKDRNQAQVSMNLVNYTKTPIFRVFEMIKSEAERWGTHVSSTEIVGLTPQKALIDCAEHYLKLENFSIAQVLEEKLAQSLARQATKSGLTGFADEVASNSPAPGGGSVAAASAMLAASLVAMVGRLTIGKKKYVEVQEKMESSIGRAEELRTALNRKIQEDAAAFNAVMAARKKPKDTDEEQQARSSAIAAATKNACRVPLEVAGMALEVLLLARQVIEFGNVNSVTDGGVGARMAQTAVYSAGWNVKINLVGLEDEQFVAEMKQKIGELEAHADSVLKECVEMVDAKI